jgi:HYDIN/CFA65/VesB family protein
MKCWLVQILCCMILLTSVDSAQDSAPAEPPVVNSSGLKVDPPKLDFGTLPVGTSSAPAITTLTNTGKERVRIVDITASGIDFNESNHCGDTIAPGASCEIQLTFKPMITGLRLGVLTVMISNRGTPRYIALAGTGQ